LILPAAGGTLRIEDAGELYSSTARRESIFVYNGKEAAALEIYRRPGADPVRLSRDIRKMLEETSSAFLRDAQIELVADSTPSLISSITGLVISASLSTIAVVIVLLLFLRRLKHSLLASISIPFSIAAGICMLSVTGKSLNSMSLSGLAMGISLVSDISVIVLDLLHRSFGNRESAPNSEEIGNKAFSIAGSSIASMLTTALVFIPIITLPGALGSLFGDIAVALVASVTAGWFYAQFCLPSLYRLFFSSAGFKSSKNIKSVFAEGSSSYLQNSVSFKNGFIKKYSELLSSLLRRPEKIFLVASILICIGFFTLFMRPITFINPDDTEEVWVSVVFPPGTLMNSLENYAIDISHYISELPSVKTVYGGAGSEEEDVNRRANIDYRREELILRCVLEKNVKPEIALVEITDIMNRFDRENNLAPFSVYFPKDRIETLLGLSSAHTFVIKANNRNELLDRIETAKNAFNAQSIAANFRPSGKRPELRLYPNREVAAHLSMSAAQIAETLYIINEGVVAAKLEIDGRPLDVRVTGQNTNSGFLTQNSIQRLEQIPLRTSQGRTVFLGSLGRIEQKEAEASLARLDRSDVIYADITAENFNSKTIKQITAQFPWFSQADESAFSRYRNSLFLYVFLVLILLYITMGAQFESFLLPLILMITIPFSLAGAGAALLIVGSKIDSGAILGLAVLFGLVVNNSLILYEISEQKIRSGLFPAAAVYRGACERFQAILITMITTIIALLPLIISPMGNSQKSMAAAMLGGLAVSTLLSLFAIPPILIRFFRWKLSRGGYK
ncbi:MAG: efflux RND transporter permease subunit, partial [Treponema sp.]|nr:efflux RND transporter permease subunit [Treponema sp.]